MARRVRRRSGNSLTDMHPLTPFVSTLIFAAASVIPSNGIWRRRIFAVGAFLSTASAVAVAAPVLFFGGLVLWGPIRIDRFGAYIVCLIALVALLAAAASVRHLARGRDGGSVTPGAERAYCVFFLLFVLSMWIAAVADNLALLWIALESTTLTTTLLVAFDRTRGAIEAAWKYIIICSTGIILGLLGVLMLIHSASGAGFGDGAFTLSSLQAHAGSLSVETLKWAFVFLIVGIGTKAGFVPMHTWLPDAHSKTPSPISAMLSGILLNVAFVILLRAKLITDAALGSWHWTVALFLIFGSLSIALPAMIMLVQKNYKRMLAYSSIEHMGIMAFAVGLGPIGLAPVLIHIAGHALAKPALFVGAGELLHETGTTRISDVRGIIARLPKTGTLLFLALLALLAAPPSALFISEFLIVGYGVASHPALTLGILALLVITAFAMMRAMVEMLFSSEPDVPGRHTAPVTAGERWNLSNAVVLVNVLLGVVLGSFLLFGPGLRYFTVLAASLSL